MIRLRFAFVWCVVLAASIAAAQEPPLELPTVPRPRTIAFTDYVVEGVAETLLAATLVVPENRDKPGGRKISIHVVVIPALTKGLKGEPLFDLAGGPGLAASVAASWYASDSTGYRATRDIVLVDQRGTGESNPLRCPELEHVSKLADIYDPDAVARCRDELSKIADLTQYGTLAAVRDLEDVRVALGYEKIDLVGLSYGTVVAQTYMREYPHNVHAAVLIGTVPIDEKLPLHHARASEDVMQKLIDDCERDPSCGGKFPSIRGDWEALLDAFEGGTVSTVYADTVDTRLVTLQRGPFFEALRTMLITTDSQRRVPYIVHHAAQGDFYPFFKLVSPDSSNSPFAEGMYLCVTCPEGTQRISEDEIVSETAGTFLGRYRVDQQIGACNQWPTDALADETLQPVTASIPTLLIAGGMDYVTPIAWAQEVSSRLSDSRVVVIDYLGHYPDGVTNMECYDTLIRAFLRAGTTVGLDVSCIETMLPPPFVTE
jgi:pimeloyl-ACP methyl ester carboxylesterase